MFRDNKYLIPSIQSAGLMLTYRCSAACRHCIYYCSPRQPDEWITLDMADRIFAALKAEGSFYGLHFAGGEPLIIPEVFKVLEICVEKGLASQIELSFNTNVTKIPQKHRDLWPQFKTVNLLCSVDAFGALNDYIRYPSKWKKIAANLNLIDREHEELNLGCAIISATVQIYNIFNLAELIEYSHKRFSFIRPMPNLIHLSTPDHFNIQFLPEDLKALVEKHVGELRQRLESSGATSGFEQLDNILAFMRSANYSPHIMNEFRRMTNAYDQLREESLVELVPELAGLMRTESTRGFDNRVKLLTSQAEWLAGRIKNKLIGD